jgi:hypothetical protein
MSLDELDKLDRQRRDADQRYNEALTAFDASLVRIGSGEAPRLTVDSSVPSIPAGWRGRSLRIVAAWLMPWIDRQHAFNAQAAEAIAALNARERERADAFERFQSALIRFLQQMTAFVETKDRQLAADAARRLDAHQVAIEQQQPTLAIVPELRAQIAVVQRATGMLKRRL